MAGSLGVVLAAAAIALAAALSVRHTDHVAVMKAWAPSTAIGLYGGSLLLLGLLATCLEWALGWLIQAVSSACSPSSWGWRPVRWATNLLIGGATALVCLGFLPGRPWAARRVPPMRVLRRDVDATRSNAGAIMPSVRSRSSVSWWYSGDLKLTGSVVAGLLLTVGLGFLLAQLLLGSGRALGSAAGCLASGFGNLRRRSSANALQMVIFAIAIMLMLVLVIIRRR